MEKPHVWTFFTNHSHVVFYLASHPDMPLREVALGIGITERAVQGIIKDLEAAGVLERQRHGRQNHYQLKLNAPLRHPLEAHRTIGDLLEVIQHDPQQNPNTLALTPQENAL